MFKKEYLVLFAVIIGACLYLYLRDRDRVHYSLPLPAPVEKAKIAEIEIQGTQPETITLRKSGGQWQMVSSGFTADEKLVHNMVDALSEVTLTALVSDSKDYDRYDLNDGKAIRVIARTGDNTVVRDLTVGKRAASGNHTFVRVGDDPFVYHVGGSYHDTFAKTAKELRDKTVLTFEADDIQQVSINTAGETLELKKVPISEAKPEAAAAGEDKTAENKPLTWKTADERPVDQAAINEMLTALSSLNCNDYLPAGAEKALTSPEYEITLTGKKTYTLSLFLLPKEDGKDYAGISSETPTAFMLLSYQAGRIMKKPSELLAGAEEN